MKEHLYVVFLGGKLPPNRVGEDHEIVFVVANSQFEAKEKAKEKWQGHTTIGLHIDAIKRIDKVDNYKIIIEKTRENKSLNKFFIEK